MGTKDIIIKKLKLKPFSLRRMRVEGFEVTAPQLAAVQLPKGKYQIIPLEKPKEDVVLLSGPGLKFPTKKSKEKKSKIVEVYKTEKKPKLVQTKKTEKEKEPKKPIMPVKKIGTEKKPVIEYFASKKVDVKSLNADQLERLHENAPKRVSSRPELVGTKEVYAYSTQIYDYYWKYRVYRDPKTGKLFALKGLTMKRRKS